MDLESLLPAVWIAINYASGISPILDAFGRALYGNHDGQRGRNFAATLRETGATIA